MSTKVTLTGVPQSQNYSLVDDNDHGSGRLKLDSPDPQVNMQADQKLPENYLSKHPPMAEIRVELADNIRKVFGIEYSPEAQYGTKFFSALYEEITESLTQKSPTLVKTVLINFKKIIDILVKNPKVQPSEASIRMANNILRLIVAKDILISMEEWGRQIKAPTPEWKEIESIEEFTKAASQIFQWMGSHGLSKTNKLQLSELGLKTVPFFISRLSSLEDLFLPNNDITFIPDSMKRLTALKVVELGQNQFTVLPDWVGDWVSLENLSLFDNRLTTLPPSLVKLTALRELDLVKNKFKTLPEFIGDLPSLKVLLLAENHLKEIPDSISRLRTLRTLDLKNNKLRSLPLSFIMLPATCTIEVEDNPLPPEFITLFQNEIKRVRSENPTLGPRFFF